MTRRKKKKAALLALVFAAGAACAYGWINRGRLAAVLAPAPAAAQAPAKKPEKGYAAQDRQKLEALIKEGAAHHD